MRKISWFLINKIGSTLHQRGLSRFLKGKASPHLFTNEMRSIHLRFVELGRILGVECFCNRLLILRLSDRRRCRLRTKFDVHTFRQYHVFTPIPIVSCWNFPEWHNCKFLSVNTNIVWLATTKVRTSCLIPCYKSKNTVSLNMSQKMRLLQWTFAP